MARSAIVGIPYNATKKPDPVGVVQAFEAMDARVIANGAGAIIRNSLSALNATTTPAAGLLAWVMGDAIVANNGVYENTGTSGTPVWVRRGPLPFGHIYAVNVGAGTADAIEVTTWLPIPTEDGAALITVPIVTPNTSSTVTIIPNGGSPLTVKTNSGNSPVVGGLSVGTITGLKIGSEFRMLSDQASTAILAAAEAAVIAASDYAALARNDFVVKRFAGDGAIVAFDLTIDPGSGNNCIVMVDGIYQQKDTYSVAGTLLTFTEAPPGNGLVYNVEISFGNQITVGTIADGSVTPDKFNAVCASRAVLKALDTTTVQSALFDGSVWQWTLGNYSAHITTDTVGGIYMKADAIAATVGAWVRQFEGPIYINWFGVMWDGLSASADANSANFQCAANVAHDFARGTLSWRQTTGTCYISDPVVFQESISLVGPDSYYGRFKKFGSAASPVYDATIKEWDLAVVGYPVCVFHFTGLEGAVGWSGRCENVFIESDTGNPNTTTTAYGIVWTGMSNGVVDCCYITGCICNFFWGSLTNIYCRITQNVSANCHYCFYVHFATSMVVSTNYSINFRFWGYRISAYYATAFANACDSGGTTWKVGTNEITLAYYFRGCRFGSVHANGCETHNGPVWKSDNNLSFAWRDNGALDISSDYTGVNDICAFEFKEDNGCEYTNNRIQLNPVTGTPARHFNWKVTTGMYGDYKYSRNKFVTDPNATTDSGWTNTSGDLRTDHGVFTGTLTGVSGTVTGDIKWAFVDGVVTLSWAVWPTGTSTSTAATITGLPVSLRPVTDKWILCRVYDNGAMVLGTMYINATGAIDLFVGAGNAGFAASGQKGLGLRQSISYPIY